MTKEFYFFVNFVIFVFFVLNKVRRIKSPPSFSIHLIALALTAGIAII